MLSPLMTVFVLAVLWLIVVVPMVLRRNDERRRERSVDGFGRAMRALGRRVAVPSAEARTEVFVPRDRRAAAAPASGPAAASSARRPVPAAREALMFPVDRTDMSAARAQMMARRRRSLSVLGIGSVVFTGVALVSGTALMWLLATPFLAGLGGYVMFLRGQARRDRDRRATRLERATQRRTRGYDVTEELARFDDATTTIVRIDDDDIELHNLDTVDLTGLYNEEHAEQVSAARRAS